MAFADLLGHDRLKALLLRALGQGRLPPALLLAGPAGVGKRTVALTAARGLLCEHGPGDPCERCHTCQRVSRGIHPDVIVVEPATAAIKIEQVRDAVREIDGRPFEARARAVVLDEAHTMTEQAMNALLKSLEEPPATSHVFLVTHAPQALLPTIRSRCQLLRFGPLPLGVLEKHLEAALGLAPAEARMRAVLSAGSLGDALAFEAEGYRTVRDAVLSVLETVPGSGPGERLQASEALAEVEDGMLALTALRSLLRDIAAARGGAGPEGLLNTDVAERVAAVARGPLGPRAVALADEVEETRTGLRGNANRLLAMDALVDRLAGSTA